MTELPVVCADIFEEICTEVVETIAPMICPHFNLVYQHAETILSRNQRSNISYNGQL